MEAPDLAARWAFALAGAESLEPRPRDLALVLSHAAVAGPGIAGLRALARVCGMPATDMPVFRDAAGQIAWTFRNLFNLPEVMAMLRGTVGLLAQSPEKTAAAIAETVRVALSLRSATLGVDEVIVDAQTNDIRVEPRRLRARLLFGSKATRGREAAR